MSFGLIVHTKVLATLAYYDRESNVPEKEKDYFANFHLLTLCDKAKTGTKEFSFYSYGFPHKGLTTKIINPHINKQMFTITLLNQN
jgi:hypothetical protein